MNTILEYIYVIGTFNGVLLGLVLIAPKQSSAASRIMGVWCVALAVLFLSELLHLKSFEQTHILVGFLKYIPVTYGALLYLYCRHSIFGDKLKKKDWLHMVPALFGYLAALPFIFASTDEKTQMMYSISSEYWRLALANSFIFMQAFVYAAVTAWLIASYQRRSINESSSFHPDVFVWLWVVQSMNFIIWLCMFVFTMFGHVKAFAFIGELLMLVYIYSVGFIQWRKPHLFRVFSEPLKKHEKTGGVLDDDSRQAILASVDQYMDEHKAYRNSELDLKSLAAQIGTSSHYLSEALNLEAKKNFYLYVNTYRVEEVCASLKEEKNVKVLDAAIAAGFASKSTFNAVFKKVKGLTPSEYRASLL